MNVTEFPDTWLGSLIHQCRDATGQRPRDRHVQQDSVLSAIRAHEAAAPLQAIHDEQLSIAIAAALDKAEQVDRETPPGAATSSPHEQAARELVKRLGMPNLLNN